MKQWTSLILLSCMTGLLLLALTQSSPVPVTDASVAQPDKIDAAALHALQSRYRNLVRQLSQLAPSQPYILVDTARNRLYIKHRDRVILDAVASTGSGTILDKPDDDSGQWIFDTPRGGFVVQSKLIHPVWIKPDWAFIEEGLEVPAHQADRVEEGVLGEYALGFGKGYFIHGTLYTRLLGKNVTHGCIRLNDEDLKRVYRLARIGTPVMIF